MALIFQSPATRQERDDDQPVPRTASLVQRRQPKSLTPETSFIFVNLRGEKARHKPNLKEIRSHVQRVTQEKMRRRQEKESNAVTKYGTLIPKDAPIWGLSWDRSDPFNSLPVEESPELREIIGFCLSHIAPPHATQMTNCESVTDFTHYPGATPLTDDSLALSASQNARRKLNWENTMWNLLRHDQLLFIVFLFGTTLVRDAVQGGQMSRQCYTYMHRTLQAVRAKLPVITDASSITEEFVISVAGLVGGTGVKSAIGDYEAANSHLKGMLTLVATRGGLETFRPFSQRTLLWCEYNIRAAEVVLPVLRPPAVPATAFPPEFENHVDKLHRRTLAHFPELACSQLSIIFWQLHLMSTALRPPWDIVIDRKAISDIIDETEYCLLHELVRLKNEREKPGFACCSWVYSTVARAAQMYVWGVLSDVKAEMRMKREFTVELRDRLNIENLLEIWSRSASLQTLFWVLLVGLFMASKYRNCSDMKVWYEIQISKIQSNEDLKSNTMDHPGTEEFYQQIQVLR